jgi:hypothetical protein
MRLWCHRHDCVIGTERTDKAETKTMQSAIEAFMTAHQLPDLVMS